MASDEVAVHSVGKLLLLLFTSSDNSFFCLIMILQIY